MKLNTIIELQKFLTEMQDKLNSLIKFENKICCYNCKHFDNSELVDDMPSERCTLLDTTILLPNKFSCSMFSYSEYDVSLASVSSGEIPKSSYDRIAPLDEPCREMEEK